MPAALSDVIVLEDWESPKWRLSSGLYTIVNAQGELIPFEMNEAQEEFFDNLHYWNIILKGRQQGFSTLMGLIALDQIMFLTRNAAQEGRQSPVQRDRAGPWQRLQRQSRHVDARRHAEPVACQ
jgi:hypothetical protein